MKYAIYPNGLIRCDDDKCGEWHHGGHNLQDILPGDTLSDEVGDEYCIACSGKSTHHVRSMEIGCRIALASRLAFHFGMIDGAHHKQWVIDQMLRVLLAEQYEVTITHMNADINFDPWDVGIAP